MNLSKFLLLLFLHFVYVYQQQIDNNNGYLTIKKLCLDKYYADSCQQLSRDYQMDCNNVPSKTDCVLDIDQNSSTLTILTAEEAFLAANLVSDTVNVIAEIVSAEQTPYQTVVIVKNDYLGGFQELQEKKFCHPGYNHDERITKYVLEEFDWKVIKLSCNGNETLIEQKFKALSQLFGSSCRPGKWTEDAQFDTYLKTKYSSLCELCGENKCETKYQAPLNDSLKCLIDNKADIALSALSYAENFFSIGSNAQDYRYLCPNGSTTRNGNPCIWTKQLNRLIITSSRSAQDMTKFLQDKLTNYIVNSDSSSMHTTLEQHIANLLSLNKNDKIQIISATPLKTYVSERRTLPTYSENDLSKCSGSFLKWSVTNDLEANKCKWLQQASLTHGLLPVIGCVKSYDNDTVSSLDNIGKEKADVTFIDASFGYIARRKLLVNAAYSETTNNKLSRIAIVVKNDTNWFTGFASLRGKGVCLPQYGGKEWLALIDFLRIKRVLPSNSTDYGLIFSDFVGDSCAPGANVPDLEIPNTNYEKICSKCYSYDATATAKYCTADETNKFFNSSGALTCLVDGGGDYAVITIEDLPQWFVRRNDQKFRIVSKNGSLASYSGFNVDENAPINIIISGEIIYDNSSLATYNDTVLYLRQMEVEFGENLEKAFKVFEQFNYTINLLFPDSTPGLTFNETTNKYIENYKRLLKNAENISIPTDDSANIIIPTIFTLLLTAILAQRI